MLDDKRQRQFSEILLHHRLQILRLKSKHKNDVKKLKNQIEVPRYIFLTKSHSINFPNNFLGSKIGSIHISIGNR